MICGSRNLKVGRQFLVSRLLACCLVIAITSPVVADDKEENVPRDRVADINQRTDLEKQLGLFQSQLLDGDFPGALKTASEFEGSLEKFDKNDPGYSTLMRALIDDVRSLADRSATDREKVVAAMNAWREGLALTRGGDVADGLTKCAASVDELRTTLGANSQLVENYRLLLLLEFRRYSLYELATALQRESDACTISRFGRDSCQYANTLRDKSELLLASGKPVDAEASIRQALAIRRRLCIDSQDYACDLMCLAHVNLALNRPEEADSLVRLVGQYARRRDVGLPCFIRGNLCAARIYLKHDYGNLKNEAATDGKASLERNWEAITRSKIEESREAAETLELLAEAWRQLDNKERAAEYDVQGRAVRLKLQEIAATVKAAIAH